MGSSLGSFGFQVFFLPLGPDLLSLYKYYRRLCCQGQLSNAEILLTNTERNLPNAEPKDQFGW
jgi:hypothetical protein